MEDHEAPEGSVAHRRMKARQAAFLESFAQTGNIQVSIDKVGIKRQNHYLWLAQPDYAEAFRQATDAALDRIEAEAVRRGVEGVEEPVYYKGEVCGHIRKYSDMLLMFILNGRRPDVFRRNASVEVTGKDGEPLIPREEQIQRLLAEASAMAAGAAAQRETQDQPSP